MTFAELLGRLKRVTSMGAYYGGGFGGTCYECPFGSEPLAKDGTVAEWRDISNDPTEAYFCCSLPGRDNEAVVWGENAPCTEQEWWDGNVSLFMSASNLGDEA